MDPTLLDEIPYAGDILPTLPPQLKARLFDLHILWNKPGNQATIHIEITGTTLQALPAILNPDQDGYHDTAAPEAADAAGSPAAVGPLTQSSIRSWMGHSSGRVPLNKSALGSTDAVARHV